MFNPQDRRAGVQARALRMRKGGSAMRRSLRLTLRCLSVVAVLAAIPLLTSPGSAGSTPDRKSTRLNSSHTVIYTLSLHDALPIFRNAQVAPSHPSVSLRCRGACCDSSPHEPGLGWQHTRSEEHTSELQSHSDLHSFPTRRSSDLPQCAGRSVSPFGVSPLSRCLLRFLSSRARARLAAH